MVVIEKEYLQKNEPEMAGVTVRIKNMQVMKTNPANPTKQTNPIKQNNPTNPTEQTNPNGCD
jgi:hypothetical protein